jgi:hypothetical protein
LMRVAAKAFHFEIAKPGVDRVSQRGGRLRRTLKAEHALVPRLDGQPVSGLAGFRSALRCRPDGCAINGFPRLSAHRPIKAGREAGGKSPITGVLPDLKLRLLVLWKTQPRVGEPYRAFCYSRASPLAARRICDFEAAFHRTPGLS